MANQEFDEFAILAKRESEAKKFGNRAEDTRAKRSDNNEAKELRIGRRIVQRKDLTTKKQRNLRIGRRIAKPRDLETRVTKRNRIASSGESHATLLMCAATLVKFALRVM